MAELKLFYKLLAYVLIFFVFTNASVANEKENWRNKVKSLNIGLLGGEKEADRLKNYECWRSHLEEELDIEVNFFPASDYAGVIHGLLGGFLDYASMGPSGYAAIYLENKEIVEPVITVQEEDGSIGYKSAMYVHKDSDIFSIEDMQNKSIAWADPNSTSGYLVPFYQLINDGFNPDTFFKRTGFAGGHEQSVIAVLNNQYDAGVTWVSGIGDASEGFSRGMLKNMMNKGLLDINKIRVIWLSDEIINGPHVIKKSLPDDFKEKLIEININMPVNNTSCFNQISMGKSMGFVRVSHNNYKNIIEMRERVKNQRRNR